MNIELLCEKYFSTKNIYEIFGIENDAPEKEIKRKYRLLILENHPDKGNSKNTSSSCSVHATTEKFQLIKILYGVLINPAQRETYDESGKIIASVASGSNAEPILVTESEILTCMGEYAHSDEERLEIQRAYEKSEGKLAYVMKMVPFLMPGRDEERVIQIIQELKDAKLVSCFDNIRGRKSSKPKTINVCCNVKKRRIQSVDGAVSESQSKKKRAKK